MPGNHKPTSRSGTVGGEAQLRLVVGARVRSDVKLTRLLCFRRSVSDGHLRQSRVGDGRRVGQRSAAAHLPHLLRHARGHGGVLRLPDQVSRRFPLSASVSCAGVAEAVSTSAAAPHRFLNQAMKMFDATEVVPVNFVFFTTSAIVAGASFFCFFAPQSSREATAPPSFRLKSIWTD